MYREQLAEYIYEKKKEAWESKPAGKRGEPPKPPRHPKFTDHLTDEKDKQSKEEIPPDIDGFGDFNVEWAE